MQSVRQLADELNRESPARRHLAFCRAARRTDPAEPRMRRRARDLLAAGRRPCCGVAVMLAAPLLFAGNANAIAATSPAGNAPVASPRNAPAPNTAVAASLARFPGAAAKTHGAASGEPAGQAAMHYPRAFIEWKLSAWPPQRA